MNTEKCTTTLSLNSYTYLHLTLCALPISLSEVPKNEFTVGKRYDDSLVIISLGSFAQSTSLYKFVKKKFVAFLGTSNLLFGVCVQLKM